MCLNISIKSIILFCIIQKLRYFHVYPQKKDLDTVKVLILAKMYS